MASPTPSAATALIFVTGGATDGLSRLSSQLAAYDADVHVVARPPYAARLRAHGLTVLESEDGRDLVREWAARSAGRLVLVDASLVAHDSVISLAMSLSPARSSAAAAAVDGYVPVTVERGRIVSTGGGAEAHVSDLVVIGTGDLGELVRRLDQDGPEMDGDVPSAALRALLAAGVPVAALRTGDLVCRRLGPGEQVGSALARVDEERARLALSVKEHDDLFTTYAVSSYSPHLVRLAARLGLTPTAVTWLSVVVAGLAASCYGWGTRPALLLGSVLVYLAFVLDCVDGQLARYTHRFSAFGGWLDAVADRAKEFGMYAGLAIGASRTGVGNLWPLAIAALTLQVTKNMTDAWYGALQDEALQQRMLAGAISIQAGLGAGHAGPDRAGPEAVGAGHPGAATRAGAVLGAVSTSVLSRPGSLLYWAKRTATFPIGERWLTIAVFAAAFGPRAVFIALLVLGGLALLYTLVGRGLRSASMRVPVMDGFDLATHRDDGPVARLLRRAGFRLPPLAMSVLAVALSGAAVGIAAAGAGRGFAAATLIPALVATVGAAAPHTGSLDWLVPAALRATEYLCVIAIGVCAGVPYPLVFALLGALALRHYDLTARLDKKASPVNGGWLVVGIEGRVTLLVVATLVGLAHFGFALVAAYCLAALIGGAALGTMGVRRRAATVAVA